MAKLVLKGKEGQQEEFNNEHINRIDNFIRDTFGVLKLNEEEETKLRLIKEKFQSILHSDLPNKDLLLSRLEFLKKDLLNSNLGLNNLFYDVLRLFSEVQLIERSSFHDLSQDLIPNLELSKEEEEKKDFIINQPSNRTFFEKLIKNKADKQKRAIKKDLVESLLNGFSKIEYSESEKIRFEHYGSSVNGLELLQSNYDISIATLELVDERKFLDWFGDECKGILEKRFEKTEYEIKKQIHEKIHIPIIEVRLKKEDVLMTFSANNKLAVQNSDLIREYVEFDSRCQDLCLLVKIWARTHKIIGAEKGFLSSYALSLLVIYFLQNLEDPILPRLQEMVQQREKPIRIIRTSRNDQFQNFFVDTSFESDKQILDMLKRKDFSNEWSVEFLLKKFLEFLSQPNNFAQSKISIKKEAKLERSEDEGSLFCSIEDPFDPKHNPGGSFKTNSSQAKLFLNIIKESLKFLQEKQVKKVFQLILL